MLQLDNQTAFQAQIFVATDPDGIDCVVTVVKGTFTLDRQPETAGEQVPINLADEYYGKPGETSIRAPSDISLAKPGTDVLLHGHAYAPGGRATSMDVSLSVGKLHKTVRVFGDRAWSSDGVGHSISPPAPFERMPLVWERAYGGADEVDSALHQEARNPVGVGFRCRSSDYRLDGQPLPNLEDPDHLITNWKQSPPPACFAAVAPDWEPRRSLAGVYDDAWREDRAPFLPEDFDNRFFQVAPPGLAAPEYLIGGESVIVRGASPNGELQSKLPELPLRVTYVVDGRREDRPANIDTVLIEPDAGRSTLVWRASYRCERLLPRVSVVEVAFTAE
jgi:hypothetical protein